MLSASGSKSTPACTMETLANEASRRMSLPEESAAIIHLGAACEAPQAQPKSSSSESEASSDETTIFTEMPQLDDKEECEEAEEEMEMDTADAQSGADSSLPKLPRPCAACRIARVKCGRTLPCARCSRLGLECRLAPALRRGRPSKHARVIRMLAQAKARVEAQAHIMQMGGHSLLMGMPMVGPDGGTLMQMPLGLAAPIHAQPMLQLQGPPMQGPPMQGAPLQGPPMQGAPLYGPLHGQPVQGQPTQGPPRFEPVRASGSVPHVQAHLPHPRAWVPEQRDMTQLMGPAQMAQAHVAPQMAHLAPAHMGQVTSSMGMQAPVAVNAVEAQPRLGQPPVMSQPVMSQPVMSRPVMCQPVMQQQPPPNMHNDPMTLVPIGRLQQLLQIESQAILSDSLVIVLRKQLESVGVKPDI